MFFSVSKQKQPGYLAMLGVFLLVCVFASSSSTLAQDDTGYIGVVRIFDPDFTLPNAAGLAYSSVTNLFFVLADRGTVQQDGESYNMTMISPYEDLAGWTNLPVAVNPINMTFDMTRNRLLLFDEADEVLIAFHTNLDGVLDPSVFIRFEAQEFDVQNPQGMTVDPETGTLYILSQAGSRIVVIKPDPEGSLDGASALEEGRISQIDLNKLELGNLQGLAFDPTDGHLYILNPVLLKLYEVSNTGELIAIRDMPVLDVGFRDPQSIVFAPSADMTDDPAQMHLFLIDSGLGPLSTDSSGKKQFFQPPVIVLNQEIRSCTDQPLSLASNEGEQGEQGPGRIIEFTLTQPVEIPRQQE